MKLETRRDCLLALGVAALALPGGVAAQQSAPKLPRIGLLASGSPLPRLPLPVEALLECLRELGYVEGRSIQIEYRWAEGKPERLGELGLMAYGVTHADLFGRSAIFVDRILKGRGRPSFRSSSRPACACCSICAPPGPWASRCRRRRCCRRIG